MNSKNEIGIVHVYLTTKMPNLKSSMNRCMYSASRKVRVHEITNKMSGQKIIRLVEIHQLLATFCHLMDQPTNTRCTSCT